MEWRQLFSFADITSVLLMAGGGMKTMWQEECQVWLWMDIGAEKGQNIAACMKDKLTRVQLYPHVELCIYLPRIMYSTLLTTK